MKICNYHPLIALLLAVAATTTSRAQLATGVRERRICHATNITVSRKELRSNSCRIERLIQVDALRAEARKNAHDLYHHLKKNGNTQAALQFYSLIGGVLNAIEFDAPAITAVFSPYPELKKEVTALQFALNQLCNLEDHEGDAVWIPQELANYYRLPDTAMTAHSGQLFLRPKRALWKAPGYAAEKMKDQTGPLLLYNYGLRRTASDSFYEVGSRPRASDAPFIAFVREADAIRLPSTPCRLKTQQKGGARLTLRTFRIVGNEISKQNPIQINTDATYPVLNDEWMSTGYITLHVIQITSPEWLTNYPRLPFAVPSRDNRKEIQ
ncbi:MAG: hypothetical protein EOM20_04170 [Spartobacteria bacterium]|nr:hypothetical protein [Spartobacteria bacterium]